MRKRYSEVKTFTEAKHKVWGFKVEIIKFRCLPLVGCLKLIKARSPNGN